MTANQGPGVPDELRNRLLDVIARGVHRAVPLGAWGDDPEYTRDCYYQAEAILEEIEAAGYAIVPVDDMIEAIGELVALDNREAVKIELAWRRIDALLSKGPAEGAEE